jgi:hypothetical protein
LDCDLQLADKFGKNYQNDLAVLNKLLLVKLKARTSLFEGYESIFSTMNIQVLDCPVFEWLFFGHF